LNYHFTKREIAPSLKGVIIPQEHDGAIFFANYLVICWF
jgi:hypothetical protein